jgi:hypothetical protein
LRVRGFLEISRSVMHATSGNGSLLWKMFSNCRHATYIVRLSGPKYDPRTLEVCNLLLGRCWSQILAPQNESVCYYDNDNRAFLKRSEVTKEDLKEGNVIKVKLDREWALGTFCHGSLRVRRVIDGR